MENMIDTARLGRHLKKLREAARLTQSQLAEAIGVTDGFISQIERGICAPSLETLARLGRLYQMPVDYLLLDSTWVLPEIQIDGSIAKKLACATPATVRAIEDMIDVLLTQQGALKRE